MNCQKCSAEIAEGEERDYFGEFLCEDCYMDKLSPPRSCDPWAAHSAKRLEQTGTDTGELNETQKRILRFLEESGETEVPAILESLGIDQAEYQRNIAPLRHMEKVRGANRDGRIVMMLWDSPEGTN